MTAPKDKVSAEQVTPLPRDELVKILQDNEYHDFGKGEARTIVAMMEQHGFAVVKATEANSYPAMKARIEQLELALRPFAEISQFITETQRDSRPIIFGMDNVIAQRLTIGHLRDARTALGGER